MGGGDGSASGVELGAPAPARRGGSGAYHRAVPELPEVETVRRTLLGALRGARLGEPVIRRRRGVIGGPADARSMLAGSVVVDVLRHGKQFAIVTDSGRALCAHLGMSGRMLVEPGGASRAPAHAHVTWPVSRARRGARPHVLLHFVDPRRFGGLWPFESVDALRRERWAALGPDALNIGPDEFVDRLKEARRAIKAAMLDQSVIAGLGNIYTDEALHAAGVHPGASAARLDRARLIRLAGEVALALRHAIDAGGSTLGDGQYVDARGESGDYQRRHRVYGRSGEYCFTCAATLRRATIAGRTTVFCPGCQPRGRAKQPRVSNEGGRVIHASPTM